MSNWKTTNTSFTDGPTVDAFGNLRTSSPRVLFESKLISDDGPLLWERVTSGSTAKSEWTSPISKYEVSGSGDYVISETYQKFVYEAGQSHKILMTFQLGAPVASTTARVGYFNSSTVAPHTADFDGLYLERDGLTVNFCVANSGSIDTYEQSTWADPLDGTGTSGVTVDWSKSQILFMDFQWLGVGRVRVGLVIGGELIYFHEVDHANVITGVYMNSANHSLRHELRSSGGQSDFHQICASVQTEGNVSNDGIIQSVTSDRAGIAVAAAGPDEAILGVRLKSGSPYAAIDVIGASILELTGNDNFQYSLIRNPTVAGAVTWQDMPTGSFQFAEGSGTNTVTAGTGVTLDSGWVAKGLSGGFTPADKSLIRPGTTIAGVQDEFWLVVYALTAGTFIGSVNVRET